MKNIILTFILIGYLNATKLWSQEDKSFRNNTPINIDNFVNLITEKLSHIQSKNDYLVALNEFSDLVDSSKIFQYENYVSYLDSLDFLLNLRDNDLKIRTLYRNFANQELFNTQEMLIINNAFSTSRYLLDFAIERNLKSRPNYSPRPNKALEGRFPHIISSDFIDRRNFMDSIQSGDILMTRGVSFTSSVISKLSTHQGQFSHIALAYRNPRSNRLEFIEALMAPGVVISSVNDFNKDEYYRIEVFRHPDSELAHRAAQIAYDKVKNSHNIIYDQGFNHDDPTTMFCSEVVRFAYAQASQNQVLIPTFFSPLPRSTNPSLFTSLGINRDSMFSPNDMQFDHRFELVAQWRNSALLEESRKKDFIIENLFRWMSEEGYQFHPSIGITTKSRAARYIRRVPFLGYFLSPLLSTTVSQSIVVMHLTVEEVGYPILDELNKAINNHNRNNDEPMTNRQISDALEDIKRIDKARYERIKELENLSGRRNRRERRRLERELVFHKFFHQ